MKVVLTNKVDLQVFPPEEIIGNFARVCTDNNKAKAERIARHCFDSGHGSPQRSVLFRFQISEVSRVFSHQHVRHNVGVAHNQRSQRYVDELGFSYVVPPSIENNPIALNIYEQFMEVADSTYYDLKQLGIPVEDVRFILPNATHTVINSVFTPQALIHYCNERLCARAQWEIREVARLMVKEVEQVSPLIAQYLVPKCEAMGYCPEKQTCGRKPTKKAVLDAYYTKEGN